MKKVLIIGKNSYVGNAWKQYVESIHREMNFEITCAGAANGEWKQVNFSGYDAVLHAAAIVHQNEKEAEEDIYRKVNYELPLEVAKQARDSHVKQFVFLSTMAVYGGVSGKITEDTKECPTTYYGKYKYMAEEALEKMHSDTFCVALIRPPMIYGKGCKGNFAKLVKLASFFWFFPLVSNKRSMLYIDNLCEYLYLVIQNEMYGVGCPQNKEYVETTDLFCKIREVHNKKTITTKAFHFFLSKATKRIRSLRKMFGNSYYVLNNPKGFYIHLDPLEYQRVNFEESIRKSL